MKSFGLVDDVITEPINGAHRSHQEIFATVKTKILSYLEELDALEPDQRINLRIEKFGKMGVWK
jgi:acetyl-CoA carboxylase carboxyl transferase subunit alpha